MRMLSAMSLSAAVGAMVLLPAGLRITAPPFQEVKGEAPLPAGDVPAFLFASVQPIEPPIAWRTIYRQVEHCAGMRGNYAAVRWAVMAGPLHGPKGPTFGFNVGDRIVIIVND